MIYDTSRCVMAIKKCDYICVVVHEGKETEKYRISPEECITMLTSIMFDKLSGSSNIRIQMDMDFYLNSMVVTRVSEGDRRIQFIYVY